MVILGFQIPAKPLHTDKIKTGLPIISWLEMTKNSRIIHVSGDTAAQDFVMCYDLIMRYDP